MIDIDDIQELIDDNGALITDTGFVLTDGIELDIDESKFFYIRYFIYPDGKPEIFEPMPDTIEDLAEKVGIPIDQLEWHMK